MEAIPHHWQSSARSSRALFYCNAPKIPVTPVSDAWSGPWSESEVYYVVYIIVALSKRFNGVELSYIEGMLWAGLVMVVCVFIFNTCYQDVVISWMYYFFCIFLFVYHIISYLDISMYTSRKYIHVWHQKLKKSRTIAMILHDSILVSLQSNTRRKLAVLTLINDLRSNHVAYF